MNVSFLGNILVIIALLLKKMAAMTKMVTKKEKKKWPRMNMTNSKALKARVRTLMMVTDQLLVTVHYLMVALSQVITRVRKVS